MPRFEKVLISDRAQDVLDRRTDAANHFPESAVIDAALEAYDIVQKDAYLARAVLRAKVQKGLDSGTAVEMQENFAAQLKARARAGLEAAEREWLEQIRAELAASKTD